MTAVAPLRICVVCLERQTGNPSGPNDSRPGAWGPETCFGLCCKLSFNLFNFGGDKAHPAKERQASRDLE